MTMGGFLKQHGFSVPAFGTMRIMPEAGGAPHIRKRNPEYPVPDSGAQPGRHPTGRPHFACSATERLRGRQPAEPMLATPAVCQGGADRVPRHYLWHRARPHARVFRACPGADCRRARGRPSAAASRALMADEPPVVRQPFEGDSMSSPMLRFPVRKCSDPAPLRADRSATAHEDCDITPRSGPGSTAAAAPHSRTVCARLHTRLASDNR